MAENAPRKRGRPALSDDVKRQRKKEYDRRYNESVKRHRIEDAQELRDARRRSEVLESEI